MRAHPTLTAGLLGMLAVAGVALSACSSSTSSVTSTTGSPATTGAPATTSPPSTTAPTSTTTARIASCTFSHLAVTSAGNSGAGHIAVILSFENTGTTSCTITGYPGVAGLNAAGQQVIQATRVQHGYIGGVPDGQPLPVVTLAPHQVASSGVEGSDVPTGTATSCPTYPSLLVTPPNTKQSVHVAFTMAGCSGIQVHPVVPGASGTL